jgi:hypothetical protein
MALLFIRMITVVLSTTSSYLAGKPMSLPDNQAAFTRYIAAGSPYTPSIILERLAVDPLTAIRRRVAENPRTPIETLVFLLRDKEADVRLAIAENPQATADIIARLLTDDNPDVRYGLAENPEMSEQVLQELARDDNPYVSQRAKRTLQMLSPAAFSEFPTGWTEQKRAGAN